MFEHFWAKESLEFQGDIFLFRAPDGEVGSKN